MFGFRHDSVNEGFLTRIIVAIEAGSSCNIRTHTSTIPNTADVVARDDLCKAAGPQMSDLNEAAVEE
jgi:hypothetical protein